jgi:hypothetical protein
MEKIDDRIPFRGPVITLREIKPVMFFLSKYPAVMGPVFIRMIGDLAAMTQAGPETDEKIKPGFGGKGRPIQI